MRFLFLIGFSLALATGYPQNTQNLEAKSLPTNNGPSEDQLAAAATGREVFEDVYEQHAEESANEENLEGSQSFYPSFAPFHNPPLGHSRPFYQQEGAYSHRPTAYQQHVGYDNTARFSGYKGDLGASASENSGLLGSGNFGVIRGGTFYNDNEGESSHYDNFNSYYQNGHGRPSFLFGNPRPRQQQQFENFRDFADINVPANPAYSQYVVVYANKNGSREEPEQQRNKPKNIMEHLALLDLEVAAEEKIPEKKLSKSKRKLAATLLGKKLKGKKTTTTTASSRDLYEPLLALS